MKKIEITLSNEKIGALLKGKRLEYRIADMPPIIIYPENYGFFLSPENLNRLRAFFDLRYGEEAFSAIEAIIKEASEQI